MGHILSLDDEGEKGYSFGVKCSIHGNKKDMKSHQLKRKRIME